MSLNELPLWAEESIVAIIISFAIAILYPTLLIQLNKLDKRWVKIIKKMVNLTLAIIAWYVLLLEKIQTHFIVLSESKLFYVAILAAIVTVVHNAIEVTED